MGHCQDFGATFEKVGRASKWRRVRKSKVYVVRFSLAGLEALARETSLIVSYNALLTLI
jgi:hypothetical protein